MDNLIDSNFTEPPDYIDGAKVIKWACSGCNPFGFVGDEKVYGLAICKYENSGNFYRFSCDKKWETIQDSHYDTIESAINQLPMQYKNVEANWQTK